MSASYSLTQTYTVTDVRYVINQFAADFHMVAEATGLGSSDNVARAVEDIHAFAAHGYVAEVTLEVRDKDGVSIGVIRYAVLENVAAVGSRPGGNRWPVLAGGGLRVIITTSKKWEALAPSQRQAFESKLNMPWPVGSGASTVGLQLVDQREYSKNAYTLRKQTWVRPGNGL